MSQTEQRHLYFAGDTPVTTFVLQGCLTDSVQEVLKAQQESSPSRGNYVKADIALGREIGERCVKRMKQSGACTYEAQCVGEVEVIIREPHVRATSFKASCHGIADAAKRRNCLEVQHKAVEPFLKEGAPVVRHM